MLKILRTIIPLCLIFIISYTGYSQENDACQPNIVITTFTENALAVTLDTWVEGYSNSGCPAYILDTATALKATYDRLQFDSANTSQEICKPESIVQSFHEAVVNNTVETWKTDYLAEPCPDYVDEHVNNLATIHETLMLSFAPPPTGSITYEGDSVILQTTDGNGVITNWSVANIEYAYADYQIQNYFVEDMRNESISQRAQVSFITMIPPSGGYILIPLNQLQKIERQAEGIFNFTLAQDVQLIGELVNCTLVDVDGNRFNLASQEQIVVITLPSRLENSRRPFANRRWQMTIGENTNWVTFPRFIFSASRRHLNCIGACGYTGHYSANEMGVSMAGSQEIDETSFSAIEKVIFYGSANRTGLVITLPNGYEVEANLVLDGAQQEILFVADVVDEQGNYQYTYVTRPLQGYVDYNRPEDDIVVELERITDNE